MTTGKEEREQLEQTDPLAPKILDTFDTLKEELAKPVRGGIELPEPKRYQLTRQQLVEATLDFVGYGRTSIGDLEVSHVTQVVKIESVVGQPTKITITMTGMPVKVRALGVVEIIDRGIETDA